MKNLIKIGLVLFMLGGAGYFIYVHQDKVHHWIEQIKPDPMRYNTYDKGQCTYYVFDKVKKDGNMISNRWGDAKDWHTGAKEDGYKVNQTPQAHALMQSPRGKIGHVAYIEQVNPDGSVKVSEMNFTEPYQITSRTISADKVQRYHYIHPKKNPKAE